MKKVAHLFLALFSALHIHAQFIDTRWGPELGKPKKTDIISMVGYHEGSFFTLRRGTGAFNRDEIYLEKYSENKLSLEFIRPVKLDVANGRRLVYEQSFVLKGRILIFMSYYDKGEDRNIAYVQSIDAASGSIVGATKEVDFIPAARKRNAGSFDFVLSKDSSKILIMHNDPFDRYENEKFSFKVLDNEAREIWSAALELPYRDKYFTVSNYVIDEAGNAYMLASLKKDKEERERKKPRYRYVLLRYDYRAKKLDEKIIDLNDQFISDIAFDVRGDHTILVGGFYSNKSSDGVTGSFFMSMDAKTLAVQRQGATDFSTQFLGEFMSKRRAEKHKELYNYKIDYLVTRGADELYIVAEQYFMVVTQVCQPKGGCTTTYNYYYNDIIVVRVNPDGSAAWTKKIPKYQASANDQGYYSSYAINTSNGQLNFIFNDNPKNLDPERKKIKSSLGRKMITVVATLDQNGNLVKKPLVNSNEDRIYTRPKISLRIAGNKTLLYAIRRKTFKFGIVTF